MAAGGTLLLGGAVLFLLSKMGKGGASTPAAPVCPSGLVLDTKSGKCVQVTTTPGTGTQTQNPGTTAGGIIGAGTTLVTTTVGLIAKAAGGGAAGGGGAGSTAAAATAVAASSFFNVGPIAVAAIIVIAVAAYMIANGISQNNNYKTFVEQAVLQENSDPILFGQKIFNGLLEKVSRWVLPNGDPLPAGWSTANGYLVVDKASPEQLRELALACLYISSFVAQARNDMLVKYLTYLGWTPAQMVQGKALQQYVVKAYPGADILGSIPSTRVGTLGFAQPVNALKRLLQPVQSALGAFGGASAWENMTRDFTVAEMRGAAVDVFGAELSRLEKAMTFYGAEKAIFFAVIEGYGSIGMNSETYAYTLGQIFGWQYVAGTFWVTNTSQPYEYGPSFWLVDPATGNRIETTATKNDGILRISQKGVKIHNFGPGAVVADAVYSPQVQPGSYTYSGFGRYGAASQSSQCVHPETGEFINCANMPIQLTTVGPVITPGLVAGGTHGSSGGGSMLPLLAAGAAALMLTGKFGQPFGPLGRMRRIRRRRR